MSAQDHEPSTLDRVDARLNELRAKRPADPGSRAFRGWLRHVDEALDARLEIQGPNQAYRDESVSGPGNAR